MSKEANLVKSLLKNDLMYMAMAGCISADSNQCVEDCENNIKNLQMLEKGLLDLEGDQTECLDFIRKGYEICERDKQMFLKMDGEK